METDFPNLEINPVSVGATENNTKIEWAENILKALFEMAKVPETLEQFLARKDLKKATLEDGSVIYIDVNNRMPVEPIKAFLNDYYAWRWAYLRTPAGDVYGQVVIGGIWEMATEKGIIEMPTIDVCGQKVFFPIDALLTAEEKNLYEIYKDFWTAVNQRDALEKQIMDLLTRLSTLSDETDIVDSNKFMKEIMDFCEWVWTVRKLSLADWVLNLEFGWRYAIDTDWDGLPFIVLPPCNVFIDLPNHRVRGWRSYHPHILSNRELCMGGVLSDIVNKCLASKSMKWLVEAMVQFWNSYTSSDCGLANDDRAPAGCVYRFISEYHWDEPDFDQLPVKFSDIMKTLMCYYNRPRRDLMLIKKHLNDVIIAGWDEANEIMSYINTNKWPERVLEMIDYLQGDTGIRNQLYERYAQYLPSNEDE